MKASRLLVPAMATIALLFVVPQLMLLRHTGDGSVWLRLMDPLYDPVGTARSGDAKTRTGQAIGHAEPLSNPRARPIMLCSVTDLRMRRACLRPPRHKARR